MKKKVMKMKCGVGVDWAIRDVMRVPDQQFSLEQSNVSDLHSSQCYVSSTLCV